MWTYIYTVTCLHSTRRLLSFWKCTIPRNRCRQHLLNTIIPHTNGCNGGRQFKVHSRLQIWWWKWEWVGRIVHIISVLKFWIYPFNLDELESEDYGEHGPFIFDSLAKGPHKFERGFSAEASFCPVHAKKASLTGELNELAEGGPRFGECLCSFGRSARDVSR